MHFSFSFRSNYRITSLKETLKTSKKFVYLWDTCISEIPGNSIKSSICLLFICFCFCQRHHHHYHYHIVSYRMAFQSFETFKCQIVCGIFEVHIPCSITLFYIVSLFFSIFPYFLFFNSFIHIPALLSFWPKWIFFWAESCWPLCRVGVSVSVSLLFCICVSMCVYLCVTIKINFHCCCFGFLAGLN